MATIFVSHSKHDVDIINFVNNAFATSPVKAAYMEFENMPEYPGLYIAQRIYDFDTKALFVLIGPNIDRNEYTSNWVAYEVGVAVGLNKPVWVLERFEDNINNRKNFPIPYVNGLFLYHLGNKEYLMYLRDVIIRRYSGSLEVAIESLLGIPFQGYNIQCPHGNCKSTFDLFNELDARISCPVCRQNVPVTTPHHKHT